MSLLALLFPTVAARYHDWKRECRISYHQDEAKFYKKRGQKAKVQWHNARARDEIAGRSAAQLRRLQARQ